MRKLPKNIWIGLVHAQQVARREEYAAMRLLPAEGARLIDYINGRLNQWGLWCLSGREKTGFPKQSAFMRLTPSKGSALAICDDEAMRVNRAVMSLDRTLRHVVVLYYVKMRSCDGETIARAMRCSRDTMYVRIHQAHVAVMDWLQTDGD